ncbi:MAG: hypothetical protein J6T57_03445 [Alphaproteobacteria bacterium]|nr:hypothetical protein [Alphaproteobacteria bacterium]
MTSISARQKGVCVDKELYDKVMTDLRAGRKNEIIRFILNQRNWIKYRTSFVNYGDGTPKQRVEDVITYSQAARLMNIYVTAIYLLRDYAKGGEANLYDDRNNAIMLHRGWYLDEFIFPPILKKIGENSLDDFYKRFVSKMTPEYGVVQSILAAKDFNDYTKKYSDNNFIRPQYDRERYMQDLYVVFDNIINGRSVVLMEPETIKAFNSFGHFCCDGNNPGVKPEYVNKIRAAAAVVQQDWNVEKARLAELKQKNQRSYGGYGNGRS